MDDLLATRREILKALKTDADLTGAVPATRIYPQAAHGEVAWPFVIYGSPTGIPIRATCVNGTEVTVAVHSYAKSRTLNGAVVETAEDHAARIGRLVVKALDGKRLPFAAGGYLAPLFTSSQLLIDGGEADAFHHVANFRCRAITS